MTILAKAYSNNRECSIQEAVYQLMSELWLRKGYPVVSFVNTNLSGERFHILKSEKELTELPEDSENVFKINVLDRYRPNETFLSGKFKILNDLCFAQFCANYQLDNSVNYDEILNDNQPIVLNDLLIEENHENGTLPKVVPLMSSKQTLKCRKVKKVLRSYTPNKNKYPEKYAHHLLMLYYPFRNEEIDLKQNSLFLDKLSDPIVLTIVNKNKEIFEPSAELVDAALRTYREDIILNLDSNAQQENEEVLELIDSNINCQDAENEFSDDELIEKIQQKTKRNI